MVPEACENFEQVVHRPAGNVRRFGKHDLIDSAKAGDQSVPTGILPASGDPAIIDKGRNHHVATVLDSLTQVAQQFGFGSGPPRVRAGVDNDALTHSHTELQNAEMSMKMVPIF